MSGIGGPAVSGSRRGVRPAAPTVFVSYRRRENTHLVGRLCERLGAVFGEGNVFRDTDSIPGAADFLSVIKQRLRTVDVVLALIGPAWHAAPPRATDDYVHLELRLALELGIPVVPVLIEGARAPAEHELPDTLRPLTARNAVQISGDDYHFRADTDRLVTAIRTLAAAARGVVPTTVPTPAPPRRRVGLVVVAIASLLAIGVALAVLLGGGGGGDGEGTPGDGTVTTEQTTPEQTTPEQTAPEQTAPETPSVETTVAGTAPESTASPGGSVLTIENPFAVIRTEPDPFATEAARVPKGAYPVLDTTLASFGGTDQRWYRIEAGGATGWIEDSVVLIAGKAGDCS